LPVRFCSCVETHILLGLVAEGSGVAIIVLKNLGVELQKIRLEVDQLAPPNPQIRAARNEPETSTAEKIIGSFLGTGRQSKRLRQTPRAKKVIEYAMEEARNFNRNYVGTENLLLGLLRAQEGVAAQWLMNQGMKLEDVREEVLNLLGHGPQDLKSKP
jgi:ATP-dependent Clp protease ATP-binding subunit ClpC